MTKIQFLVLFFVIMNDEVCKEIVKHKNLG